MNTGYLPKNKAADIKYVLFEWYLHYTLSALFVKRLLALRMANNKRKQNTK